MGKKVVYTIRFYRMHDIDLYSFIDTYKFNTVKAIYCALKAFANDDLFVIDIPEQRKKEDISQSRVRTKLLFLDDERDQDILTMMNRVTKGYRNNFIKNILRLYLAYPATEDFFVSQDDAEWFKSKYRIFRAGKRVAKAGSFSRKGFDLYEDGEGSDSKASRKKGKLGARKKQESAALAMQSTGAPIKAPVPEAENDPADNIPAPDAFLSRKAQDDTEDAGAAVTRGVHDEAPAEQIVSDAESEELTKLLMGLD